MNNDVDSDFFTELDVFVRAEYDKTIRTIKAMEISVTELGIRIPTSNEFLTKYQLNEKITFALSMTSNPYWKINYLYDGIEIKPDCHFITPDYYVPVPTLTVIREAIRQNTHEPDIKPLELELARANGLANKDKIQVIEILD